MRIKNRARTALVLDKAKDKVELRFGSKRVSGILNLAANDRATWDSLGKEMKDLVMYPSQVEGGEEEGIYIFIPQKSLHEFAPNREMPYSLEFSVASLKKTLDLSPPRTAE